MQQGGFTLTNRTKGKLPRLPFRRMKEAVLGADYDLSVSFVSPKRMHELNLAYRKLDSATDILSFPLDRTSGEMYISISEAKKECVKFGRTLPNFIGFLFIHGLVHLDGYDHGSRMEQRERSFRTKFGI